MLEHKPFFYNLAQPPSARVRDAVRLRCSVPKYDGTGSDAIDKDGTWGRFFRIFSSGFLYQNSAR
jgi:hypothetical protein